MPIYDIFETKEEPEADPQPPIPASRKDRIFSILTARLLFFLLLVADLLWAVYSLTLLSFSLAVNFLTFFKLKKPCQRMKKQWIALKRASVCGIALTVSIFSPALGIMIACTYFLMYDKTGIQEVVPTSLHEQFQEFLK